MPTIDLGKVVGEQGPTGERGSVWYTGTGVTGTETSGTVMPSSGVENARTNDMYLNSSTSDTYMCVFPGDANTAQWAWSGNIKGNTGNPGPAGPTGSVDENTPILFTQAMLKENITSGEAIAIMFGKIAKWFNDFGTAAWASVVNNGTTFSEGTVLDGRMGKALTDSIGTLTDLDTTEKTSLVGAINELNGNIATISNNLFFVNTVPTTDGSAFNKNFLFIDLNDATGERNKTSYFSKPADDSEWSNFPGEMYGKLWTGIRFVLRRNNMHTLVEIHEMFPVHGRIWSNFYNSDLSWQGWKSITPQ